MRYSFVWNGINSRNKGIRLQSMPEIIRPEERVEHVVIPGRPGEMTLTEGEDIYNSYIVTIPISVDSLEHVKNAETWLKGDGWVTFCNEPDRQQWARIINAVTFTKHSRNSAWWEAEVQFYCEPVKRLINEENVEITMSAVPVNNPGTLKAFPNIGIVCEGSPTVTITINGRTITIQDAINGYVVDCENEWVTLSGIPQGYICSGEFPWLNPGDNPVLFTGATKLVIQKNSRFI